MPALIYIHGFNSSSASYKAGRLHEYMGRVGLADSLHVPQLPANPSEAIHLLEQTIVQCQGETAALMGSSLGGYYATWLAEKYDLRAVLINPAVYPYKLLQGYMGENTNPYTGERYRIDESYIQALKALEVTSPAHPENLMILLEKGDKVLNYQEAVEKFRNSTLRIFEGGSHEFVNFERQLDDMLVYCGYSL